MLSVTITGRAHGPREVRDELTMNDFLREYLGMTGTKFGCGAAQCLSCAGGSGVAGSRRVGI
jgi:aerobic-type carbon monoxide dehydrogenase small subunit (CoxS/CutS family)